jgi:hypothetical protein
MNTWNTRLATQAAHTLRKTQHRTLTPKQKQTKRQHQRTHAAYHQEHRWWAHGAYHDGTDWCPEPRPPRKPKHKK